MGIEQPRTAEMAFVRAHARARPVKSVRAGRSPTAARPSVRNRG